MRQINFRNILVSVLVTVATLRAAEPNQTSASAGSFAVRKASQERAADPRSADGNPKFVAIEHREAPFGAEPRASAAAASIGESSKGALGVTAEAPSAAGLTSQKSGYSLEFGRGNAAPKPSQDRAASTDSLPGPRSANDLAPGTSATFSFPAVASPTLFTGDFAYKIVVPPGATRLTVRLSTTTPNADVDLFLRYGTEPRVGDGRVEADFAAEGPTGEETLSVSAGSSPALRPGTYYIAFAVFQTGVAVSGRVSATVEGAGSAVPPPPSAGNQLTSGTPVRVSVPAAANGALFVGSYIYTINVPSGASRLVVRAAAQQSGVDVDLFVRRAAAPSVNSEGKVAADHASEGPDGNETVTVDSGSNPSLQPGLYYIALATFTPGRAVDVMLTATIDNSAVAPPEPTAGQFLRPGSPVQVQLPAVADPTLFTGDYGYRVQIPAGATRLQIRFTSPSQAARVQLFLRYGADVDLAETRPVADHASPDASANETLTVLSNSAPALRPGIYYLAFGVPSTGVPTSGTLSVSIDSTPVADPNLLRSGTPANFSLPAVDGPTVFLGDYSYRIVVPDGAKRLEVRLVTATPDADVDLYLRHGRDNAVVDGRPDTDHSSEGVTGNETIIVTPGSSPALRPGTYYISFGLFTKDKPVTGTVTAVVQ